MTVNDAHCHFFSPAFFAALARQRSRDESPADLCSHLQWDDPHSPEQLADRWVAELDARGVQRAALIASVPGDEESVAAAVARHPARFVGFFMLDASPGDAPQRARRAVEELGLSGVCLFPAMHHVAADDERVFRIAEAVAATPGTAMFVHCGVLTVGVRRRLNLPSPFNLRLGDPLSLTRLALAFPQLPIIVPHFGAGLLREALMAADVCHNIVLDTSSSNSWMRYTPGLTLEEVLRAALAVVGPSRLLFGTDSSFFPRGWQSDIHDRQREALASIGAADAEQALVFGGNSDRLFPRQLGAA
jgi:predicted TIM-barrel fold metal-dependent hydrolase